MPGEEGGQGFRFSGEAWKGVELAWVPMTKGIPPCRDWDSGVEMKRGH